MHPILWSIPSWVPVVGGAPISSFGVFFGLAIILGWSLSRRAAEEAGLPGRDVGLALVAAIVAGYLGARGIYLLAHPDRAQGVAALFAFDPAGLLGTGGLVVGGAVAWLVARARRLPFGRLADCAAVGSALGVALVHVGGFLHGAGYGRPSASGLAIRFPMWPGHVAVDMGTVGPAAFADELSASAGALTDHVVRQAGQLGAMVARGMDGFADAHVASMAKLQALGALTLGGFTSPVLPAQLLAAGNAVVALLVAIGLGRRRGAAGQVMAGLMVYYGLSRCFLVTTLAPAQAVWIGPVKLDMLLGVGVAVGGAVLWYSRRRRIPPRRGPASSPKASG